MSKIVSINKEEIKVSNDEFNFLKHDTFNNLQIAESLGILERLSGFFNDLSLVFDEHIDIFMFNIGHGGFIPLEISKNYKTIYIHYNEGKITNIMSNAEKRNITNMLYFEEYEVINKKYTEPRVEFINNNIQVLDPTKNVLVCVMMTDHDYDQYIKYNITNTSYFVYVRQDIHDKFLKEFNYYVLTQYNDNTITYLLNYDNLVHLSMIVKNAGESFEKVLIENFPYFDRWTILDTGSTDGTIETIKKTLVGKKKGQLYEESFTNFRDSRNKCLDLCGKHCKFIVVLDDTYILKNNLRVFLNEIRGDQFADTYSLFIQSNDTEYGSNRILKSKTGIRYKYKIHEVLDPTDNINVMVPSQSAYIFDERNEYMEKRTMDRKKYDLEILEEMYNENPEDSRPLYYMGQTYNLLEQFELAFEYFMKRVDHPDEGFIQEKVDACFEAARLCNFRLNKPWDECEQIYNRCYELDKSRPECLYFIGVHYYLEKNYLKAYEYMKKGFEIGYPLHCQYSLKPTLSFFYLPKFLSEICFIIEDFHLGLKASRLFLDNNPEDINICMEYQTVKCWNKIFDKLISLETTSPLLNTVPLNSKPLLVFIADGGFNLWKGSDILDKGVGGSETFIIEISKHIQKKNVFDVYVFCQCSEEETYCGVNYQKLESIPSFLKNNKIHTCIVSRYPEYLPMIYKNKVDNVHLILHDLIPNGEVIVKNDKLKNVFCLTEWHKLQFISLFPDMMNRVKVLNYGINISEFKNTNIAKKPFQFIYSSFPHRGLLQLLEMWPDIVRRYPIASLQIHCDIENAWVNFVRKDDMIEIKTLLKKYNEKPDLYHVFYKGWTSKKELYQSFLTSDVWFYPCTFLETFCLTALEAASSKTLVFTSSLGALQETVGDRGIMIPGDPYTLQWKQKALSALFTVLDDTILKDSLIEKNYNWARKMSWKKRCDELLEIIYPDMFEQNRNDGLEDDEDEFVFVTKMQSTVDIENINSGNSFVLPSKILDYLNFKTSKKVVRVLEIGNFAVSKQISLKSLTDSVEKCIISSIAEQKNFVNENNTYGTFLEKNSNITFEETQDFIKYTLMDSNIYDMILFVDKINVNTFYVLASYCLTTLKKGGIFGFITNHNSIQSFLNDNKDDIFVLHNDNEQIFIEKK